MSASERDREAARRDRIGQALRIYAMAHGWSHLSPEPAADWDDMAEHRKERWRVIADVVLADVDTARAEGETAGYAKGRREAFEEAATMFPVGWHGAADIAAALRAKADAEAPHE